MKIRNGFVSNSSSSSFVVPTAMLSPLQIWAVLTNTQTDQEYTRPIWEIGLIDGYLVGYTSMDNYDMIEFLKKVGIPSKDISGTDRFYGSLESTLEWYKDEILNNPNRKE